MPTPVEPLHLGVLGAGAIGCWVGGMLAADAAVTLVGRPRVHDPIRESGLTVESPEERPRLVPPDRLHLTTDVRDLVDAQVVLLCVKSRDTAPAVANAASHLRPGAIVVSLQNGLHNPERAREALAAQGVSAHVLAGMVPFNVARTGPSTYRRATSGGILVEDDARAEPLVAAAQRSGLPLATHPDLPGIQRAKLLMNMSNAVNALCGLPLRDQFADRDLRKVVAVCQEEGLRVLEAAGTPPARIGRLGTRDMIRVLRLPTPLFALLAKAQLRIDPAATSSMSDDLDAGRPTEVDELQGEVVQLGQRHGIPTPACAAVVALVHDAERRGSGDRPRWSGPDLLAAVAGGAAGGPPA
ncbi:2-dehydropantoate 2-reductase [Nostocoides japonicum T1-X7]|uniref:2-dehydropantoate 2-reductase n=1 Tax=Nostocoides japonicum T1-X7 TaxID=1194083 RepID=A0A077M0F0_9MICO|nr:2-dehydropantoate 2-reductase [Tetrasphaera japonica]CCH77664.1 2-dehydropantoate 2-reductase [Tetrasphaera japonica T1-X7]